MFEQFFSNFYDYSFVDILRSILDIVIVWYLLYQILMLIRGTKAMQILIGLLIFAFFYFISQPEILDLATLNWTIDKFISSFVIIIVIIFQEDIRRGLSQFGKSGSLATSANQDQARLGATPIEELVKAATILSDRRIGALVAIEMDAALDQYMVQGVKVDAKITKELLVSLFIPYKANPTHDGAVIIKNGRIESCACFLPLSANDKIDKALGTRHRAAIGLSEATDAVILVVSEETGAISIAHNEKLLRRLSPESLRDELHKFFVTNDETNNTPTSLSHKIKAFFKTGKPSGH